MTLADAFSHSFVEFETAADLRTAVEKLDSREFKGQRVNCVPNTQPEPPRDRARSRSPHRGRPYMPPQDDYDRRGPPRGAYSPRRDGYRDGYRDRSPPPPRRDYYDDRRGYRSPPRRGPVDDYPPPRGRYDDPYRAPRDYPPDPYMNGRAPYDRRPPPPEFPPRDAYPRDGYPREDYGRRY
jgi:RNA recognition motif-containing protein